MLSNKQRLQKVTILVVDDDPDILAAIQTGIELPGLRFVVLSALNGREGLETARRVKPDLIILDLLMPELDGLSVLEQVRLDPNLRGTKVIMLTAQDNQKNRWESLYLDVDDFVSKPFDLFELEALIYYQLVGKKVTG